MTEVSIAGPRAEVVLDIPAAPSMVGTARLLVSCLASARRELSADRVDALKLAVSEACANAIEAYGPEALDPRVSVSWAEDDERIHVYVADTGRGYDSEKVVSARSEGFGVGLIRALVDDVDFVGGARGTTVRMTMNCSRAEPEDD